MICKKHKFIVFFSNGKITNKLKRRSLSNYGLSKRAQHAKLINSTRKRIITITFQIWKRTSILKKSHTGGSVVRR